MEYKGYVGSVEFDEDSHIFYGSVINTRAVIDYYGKTIEELKSEFEFSVNEYINWCRDDGIEPEMPKPI